MAYRVKFGSSVFAVPGTVADHYLKLADTAQLRVLLYFLRHAMEAPDAAALAEALSMEEDEVRAAMSFWMRADVIEDTAAVAKEKRENWKPPEDLKPEATGAPLKTEVTGAPLKSENLKPDATGAPSQPEDLKTAESQPARAARAQRTSAEAPLDPKAISEILESSPAIADMFTIAEKKLGRPLTHMEHRMLLWLSEYLGFPSEVILMLLEHCVSNEKYSVRYMEEIAAGWWEEGILTPAQAEEELDKRNRDDRYIREIKRLFEMNRNPTTAQREFIEQWQQAGYSFDLIHYAYERTIETIEKLNFKYINKILCDWASQGVKTPEEAKKLKRSGKKSKKKASESTMTEKEREQMNEYLSLVNHFEEDEL